MSYLRYLCLFTYSGVNAYCVVVYCFVCLHLVYPMLSVSLDRCYEEIVTDITRRVYEWKDT
jgi:hypothetical protein